MIRSNNNFDIDHWSLFNEINIQYPSKVYPRTTNDGSISFSFGNSITTWDFINNKRFIKQYGVHQITTFIELNKYCKSLIVGNIIGDIYFPHNESTSTETLIIEQPTLKVGQDLYSIKYIGNSINKYIIYSKIQPNTIDLIIYDYHNKKKDIIRLVAQSSDSKLIVLSNNDILEYNNNYLILYKLDLEKNEFISRNKKEFIDGISLVSSLYSDCLVYILNFRQTNITIWNIINDSYHVINVDNSISDHLIYDIKELGEDVIAVSTRQSNGFHYYIFNKTNGTWRHLENNYQDLIQLSDGSFLVTKAMESGNSLLEILSPNDLHLIFRYESREIVSINTNQYGFIIVQLEDKLVVFKPTYKPNMTLTVDLISKMKFAIKQCDSYQARKILDTFIKNEASETTTNTTPIPIDEIYQLYDLLTQSPFESELRRLSLYLFKITGDSKYISIFQKNNGKCKSRLILGDGDFSFTASLLEKHKITHPKLLNSILATELSDNPLDQETIIENMEQLRLKGVKTILGVNGVDISKLFHGRRFKRIHLNNPWPESDINLLLQYIKSTLVEIFQSASQLQQNGDRFHLTIEQEPEKKKYKQMENPIVRASTAANYRLIRKRRFMKDRYPGYQHHFTDLVRKYPSDCKREFIFEKVNPQDIPTSKGDEITTSSITTSTTIKTNSATITTSSSSSIMDNCIKLRDKFKKNYNVVFESATNTPYFKNKPEPVTLTDYYIDCSTDEDSSDYYEDSNDDEDDF